MKTLKELFNHTAEWAEGMFARTGSIEPMFVGLSGAGDLLIISVSFGSKADKAQAAEAAKQIFAEQHATAYVFLSEGWAVALDATQPNAKEIAEQIVPSQHARRMEVLILSGEDALGQSLFKRWEIVREEGKAPKLKADKDMEGTSGQGLFTGLLPKAKPSATKH